jgi:predicted nucleotidyltransferase
MTRQPVTRQHALDVIAAHREELRGRFHVTYLALFGSVARDEATAESDVDVLVEFDQPIGLFEVFRLRRYLEALFDGTPVDVVIPDEVRPVLRETIFAEAIRAA